MKILFPAFLTTGGRRVFSDTDLKEMTKRLVQRKDDGLS